jgi:hypothetical protein
MLLPSTVLSAWIVTTAGAFDSPSRKHWLPLKAQASTPTMRTSGALPPKPSM